MARELKRILYVEDEADIQVIARLALEQIGGFEVEMCSSGAEALERIAREPFDLALLDVMMPEMDGEATLAAIRQTSMGQRLPVIFVTARVQAHEVMRYKRVGAIGVIAKPFDPMRLASKISALWEEHVASQH